MMVTFQWCLRCALGPPAHEWSGMLRLGSYHWSSSSTKHLLVQLVIKAVMQAWYPLTELLDEWNSRLITPAAA